MKLRITLGDITKSDAEAIVNAANTTLLGGGGVDGAIHKAAGPKLLEECRKLNGCRTGEAKITKGYNLKAKYIIHTAGPIWRGGGNHEAELLEACYKNSLELAEKYEISHIAFPSISTGVYAFPVEFAARIAINAIVKYMGDRQVDVVCFDSHTLGIYKKILLELSGSNSKLN